MKQIIFNSGMVKTILRGEKTCTIKIIKGVDEFNFIGVNSENENIFEHDSNNIENIKIKKCIKVPYLPGDIIYVKETWAVCSGLELCSPNEIDIEHQKKENLIWYKADGKQLNKGETAGEYLIGRGRWRPAICMPQAAARIFLRIKHVRIARLHDITEEDARNEGVVPDAEGLLTDPISGYKRGFKYYWNKTNNNWHKNPWVFIIKFERI